MNEIKELLVESGWYEGRKIEIQYMIDDLRNAGLTLPNELIQELLAEFWNIEINFTLPDGMSSNIRLNVEEAMMGIMVEELSKLENAIKDKIVPVGLIHFESGLLFVSYTEKFYLIADKQVFLVGINFFDMLDTVIFRKAMAQLS